MKDIRIELIYAVPLTTNVIYFYVLQVITILNLCCIFFFSFHFFRRKSAMLLWNSCLSFISIFFRRRVFLFQPVKFEACLNKGERTNQEGNWREARGRTSPPHLVRALVTCLAALQSWGTARNLVFFLALFCYFSKHHTMLTYPYP